MLFVWFQTVAGQFKTCGVAGVTAGGQSGRNEHATVLLRGYRNRQFLAVVSMSGKTTRVTAMRWSKLKSRVKDLIAPELRDRIDFHLTSYRASHDEADKVWITIDGKRVFSCKHYEHEWASCAAYRSELHGKEVKSVLREVQIHSPSDFGNAMRSYLKMSVTVALTSDDPLIQAFAIVDRRIGKRSLAKLDLSNSEHVLVKAFFELRDSMSRRRKVGSNYS